jgi:hypothetical protein
VAAVSAGVVIAHLAVLALLLAGERWNWRLPDAHTPNPTRLQRVFVQMAITGFALLLLPLEDGIGWMRRARKGALRPI